MSEIADTERLEVLASEITTICHHAMVYLPLRTI
jgi:hypothetical protein